MNGVGAHDEELVLGSVCVMVRSASIPPAAVGPLGIDDTDRPGTSRCVAAQAIEGRPAHPGPWTMNLDMKDMSIRITSSRQARCSSAAVLEPILSLPGILLDLRPSCPFGAYQSRDFPACRLHEESTGLRETVVQDVALHVSGRLEGFVREVDLVHLADDLAGPITCGRHRLVW